MKWSQEETTKFVELYKELHCLWDNKSVDYKNNKRRIEAYETLVKKMHIPDFTIAEAKGKINNLRNTYFQEKIKIYKSKASGGEVYQPTVKWFSVADSFMGRKTSPTPVMLDYSPSTTNENIELKETKRNNENKIQQSCRAEELLAAAKELSEVKQCLQVRDEDEFDAFGRVVALSLRKLPLPIALMAQNDIQPILSKYRLEAFNQSEPTIEVEVISVPHDER